MNINNTFQLKLITINLILLVTKLLTQPTLNIMITKQRSTAIVKRFSLDIYRMNFNFNDVDVFNELFRCIFSINKLNDKGKYKDILLFPVLVINLSLLVFVSRNKSQLFSSYFIHILYHRVGTLSN